MFEFAAVIEEEAQALGLLQSLILPNGVEVPGSLQHPDALAFEGMVQPGAVFFEYRVTADRSFRVGMAVQLQGGAWRVAQAPVLLRAGSHARVQLTPLASVPA